MTTTDLLRDVLHADADAAATPERVTAVRARLFADTAAPTAMPAAVVIADTAGRTPRRRRTFAVVIGAAAATVAAALVVAGFVADRPGDGGSLPAATTPASALPLTEYGFTVGADPGGLPFQYLGTARGVQGGVWRAGAVTPAAASLDVLTGTGDTPVPVRPADASAWVGHGEAGWTAPVTAVGLDLFFGIDPADTLTVWRDDTTGLWAALLTDGLGAERIRELAATVRLGDYHAVRSPVRLSSLPAGSELTAVSEGPGTFELVFGPHGSQFTLAVGPAGSASADAGTGAVAPQPITVGPFTGTYRAGDPVTTVSSGSVEVVVVDGPGQADRPGGPTAAMPAEQLTALLTGLTVADLTAPGSWTDLATALPRS